MINLKKTRKYLEHESKACWVERHEGEVVSDDGQTAEATHDL